MSLLGFLRNRDGAVAPMFGLLIVPLVGLTGAAIDFSRANSVRASMQASLDAAALTLSKDVAGLTPAQMNQKATDYFKANFNRPEATGVAVTPTYTANPSTLTVKGSASIDTPFIKVLGFSTLKVETSSTVTWGQSRLRVALVLDNTGSMASANKMSSLKGAAVKLLDQLKAAASAKEDVYVSIIPFAKDVNVDPVNYSQNWVKWSGSSDTWNENNGDCSKDSRRKEYASKSACTSAGGTWTPENHNTWNGCVMDRDQSYDIANTAPATGTTGTLFPAEQYDNCPVPMLGLTSIKDGYTTLTTKIGDMQPDGATNQAIGLQWGFQSLTSAPFTIPAYDPNFQYQQVVILLTDGLNTQDRWYGNGSDPSTQVDARQALLCETMKGKPYNITIYAIQVATDGDPVSTMLKNCSSDPSTNYFFLTSAGQIAGVFNQIGTKLSQLRISK